jgi:hypothetical protein
MWRRSVPAFRHASPSPLYHLMKSFVLILWLLMGDGRQQAILTQYVDNEAACVATATVLADKYAARGQRVRYLCHEVVPEVGDVDEMGNPIAADPSAQ